MKKIELILKSFIYLLFRIIFKNKAKSLPINPEHFRKILILRYDAIGDMVVTSPFIEVLKRNLPNLEIHIIASHRNQSIIRFNPYIDSVFIYKYTLMSFVKMVLKLRKERYDAVFNLVLNKTTFAGVLGNLIGGRNAVKLTIAHKARTHLYSALYNTQVDMDDLRDNMTMAELQVIMLIRVFNWNSLKMPDMKIYTNSTNEDFAIKASQNWEGAKKIALNISSGNKYRKLSVSKNIMLIERILKSYKDFSIIVISTPQDKKDAEIITNYFKSNVYLCPLSGDILDVSAIIGKIDLVITPDTSIVHIAASFRKPVLVMYSRLASFVNEWLPYGVTCKVVITKEKEHLENLDIEEIFKNFKSLLQETGNG